jgi:hypothetical protein
MPDAQCSMLNVHWDFGLWTLDLGSYQLPASAFGFGFGIWHLALALGIWH